MMKRVLIILTLILTKQMVYSQVGIGTTSPDNSSVLDVSSTQKGILFPRMTIVQRDAITAPAKGLTIYNLDENCLQINLGSSSSPNWSCIRGGASTSVVSDCNTNGFEGEFVNGVALTASNKFSVTINNNSFTSDVSMDLDVGDLVLHSVSGISVSSVNPTSITVSPGSSQLVEYTLTGTPTSAGVLIGSWSKLGLSCFQTVDVINGRATFESTLPSALVVSMNDGTPVVDVQGVVDNNTNQLTVSIPYTGGIGSYSAYTGTYVPNNAGTAEGGDANSFRLTYPAGTFSTSGEIVATLQVDGDGSFNAKKLLFNSQELIATLDFKVNGVSHGNVNLNVISGTPDRNFADADHQFVYFPVTAADGNVWLNHNLGAHYTDLNHPQFNPVQQATSHDDFLAYGSLYQWGRFSDGHELCTYTNGTTGAADNGITFANANSDTPGDNLFISALNTNGDWRIPSNNNLWQGEAGINNPCPNGYRIPTIAELNALITAEGITNYTNAASSTLAFTSSGERFTFGGSINGLAINGIYWTSTTSGTGGEQAEGRVFNVGSTTQNTIVRANGYSVRCIQD